MQLITFILILSVLVLIHELGHFLAAKAFGMRVEEFGIGIPPRAKKLFTWWNTLFTINWLPIGGFVKIYGEDVESEEQIKSKEAFFNKPIWQRGIVLSAGVMMNFVLGVLLFGVVYSVMGVPTETDSVRIVEVAENSPASEVEIVLESRVVEIRDGGEVVPFVGVTGFVETINRLKGKEIEILLESKGEEAIVKVTPRLNPPEGQGSLGVVLSSVEMVKYPWYQMPFKGVWYGLKEAWGWGKEIVTNLGQVLYGIFTGKGLPKDVAGPVGIYQVSKSVYSYGFLAILQFMGILSINLAILNIMPFPALDGGRIVFLAVEKIIGKNLKNRFEGYVHAVGMYLLLALMLMITVRDVIRLVTGG